MAETADRFDAAWRANLAREYEVWWLQRETVHMLILLGGRTEAMRVATPLEPTPLHTIFLVT